jgi:hypothetical protein
VIVAPELPFLVHGLPPRHGCSKYRPRGRPSGRLGAEPGRGC